MDRLLDGYCRGLQAAIAALLAVMVVLVFGNVVMRYVFNSGIALSEEVSRWLFVWLTFLGGIVALREHAHLGTDMLVSRLPVSGKKACLVAGHVLMLYISWIMLKGSLEQAQINYHVAAPVSGASMSVFYAAGVLFAGSAIVILSRDLWLVVTGQVKDADLVMIKESEEASDLESLQAELARTHADTGRVLPANAGSRP